ncbi:MAG: hypothetical protein QOG31_14 [Thermoplasmata archaeon]|jgi:hypothetical protein|nr:hypothetical protein [Thermoplasmata archaeon]
MKALAALLLLGALLAGCSNPSRDTLGAVYPDDFDPSGGIPVVRGTHLEARVGGGDWLPRLDLDVQAPPLAGPPMAAAAPQGGGGDVQRLPAANATVEVRIREATRLGGLTAHWFVLDNGTAPGALSTAQATLPGDGTFHATLSRAGPFLVAVVLTGSSVDDTPQAAYEPLPGRLAVTWMATGQVEPIVPTQPPAGPRPPSTPREQMVDRYDLDVRPGAHLVAATSFEGQYMGREGTDVDVGLYAPDGRPVACGSSGGGQVPVVGGGTPVPDPNQANEQAVTDASVGGAWSVQVGAQQDGCGGGAFFYANAGPVPYRLILKAS